MKKADILALVQGGLLDVTTRTLSTAAAYSVYKFRKSLRALHDGVSADLRGLLSEIGVDDPAAFDARKKELAEKEDLTEEEQREFVGLVASLDRYIDLRSSLLDEPVEIASMRPLTWEEWHTLQVENPKVGSLTGYAEETLEDILWTAPEE